MNVDFRTNMIDSSRLIISTDKKHEQRCKVAGLEVAAYIEGSRSAKEALATAAGRWIPLGKNEEGKAVFVSIDSIAKQSGLTHKEVKQAIKEGGESRLKFEIYTKLFNAFKNDSSSNKNIQRIVNAAINDSRFFKHIKEIAEEIDNQERDTRVTPFSESEMKTMDRLKELNSMVKSYTANKVKAFNDPLFFNTKKPVLLECLLNTAPFTDKKEVVKGMSGEKLMHLLSKQKDMLHILVSGGNKKEQQALLQTIREKVSVAHLSPAFIKILDNNPNEKLLLNEASSNQHVAYDAKVRQGKEDEKQLAENNAKVAKNLVKSAELRIKREEASLLKALGENGETQPTEASTAVREARKAVRSEDFAVVDRERKLILSQIHTLGKMISDSALTKKENLWDDPELGLPEIKNYQRELKDATSLKRMKGTLNNLKEFLGTQIVKDKRNNGDVVSILGTVRNILSQIAKTEKTVKLMR